MADSSDSLTQQVFHGTLVHSTQSQGFHIQEDAYIGVKQGKIIFIETSASAGQEVKDRHGLQDSDIIRLNPGEFLCPGFIDTHIHASQYSNCGKALDLPLLQWLEIYTFPTESRFSDADVAKDIYSKCVRKVLKNGTTTACYFATIDTDSSLLLCDTIENNGQRAYVGKVNMDQNSPEFYIEDSKKSLEETERFIKLVQQRQSSLLEPVITPRFAPSVTEQLMCELGNLAKNYKVPVQTHLAETRAECEWVKKLFPKYDHYVDIYDKCGLMSDKTVFAHGIYLSEQELQMIKDAGAGISHCANSNTSIRSGFCDVRNLMDKQVKVGLGTDCSGGYSPSLMDSMRQAIQVSNTLAIQNKDNYNPLNFKDVFTLATIGGAQVLGLDDKIGNFEVGKEFDALHLSLSGSQSPVDVFSGESMEELVQKFIFLGDDRNIKSIYVAGRNVRNSVIS